MSEKIILLDRDGVINEDSDAYIKSLDEWIPIEGSIEAIALLTQKGYRIFVITNQSGVGRGYFSLADLDAMDQKMHSLVNAAGGKIEAIYFCPHIPDEGCACRKPKPGLLKQIAHDEKINLMGVPLVGDSLRDIEAAQQVGAHGILVRTGKGERMIKTENTDGISIYDNLFAVAQAL